MSSQRNVKKLNPNEITRQKMTSQELSEAREAFDLFDDDKDGIITTKEVKPAMRALGYNPNSVILDKIKAIDIGREDGDGSLNYEDFLNLVCQQIRYSFSSEDMFKDFEEIDVNNDGKITKLELRRYLENLGMPFSDEEIDGIVFEADLNNDGFIDYKEFVRMMCPDRPDV